MDPCPPRRHAGKRQGDLKERTGGNIRTGKASGGYEKRGGEWIPFPENRMDPKTNVKGFPPPFPHRTQPGKRHNPSDFAFGEATSLYTREASALRAPGSLPPPGEGGCASTRMRGRFRFPFPVLQNARNSIPALRERRPAPRRPGLIREARFPGSPTWRYPEIRRRGSENAPSGRLRA